MLSFEEIQQYLIGAWRMMLGKADGLRMLDLSADGFWNSFFAIVVALPALIVGWAGVANELTAGPGDVGGRLSILARLAVIDLCAWVAPLVLLAAIAPQARISDRFVHYVVASNWGSALVVWMMLPPALIRLFAPGATEIDSVLSLLLFVVSMALTWRLTNVAIGKGAAIGSAVFAGTFIASLAVLLLLQHMLGLAVTDQFVG